MADYKKPSDLEVSPMLHLKNVFDCGASGAKALGCPATWNKAEAFPTAC